MPVATPVPASAAALASVRYNADGLVPAIIQDHDSRAVLMMGWMNAETLAESLATGRTVFWSRSRRARWRKGDTSGDRQWVREAYYDCDGDTLLFVVEQEGQGACHTGERSCFFRSFHAVAAGEDHILGPSAPAYRGAAAGQATPAGKTAPAGRTAPAGEGPGSR